PAHRAAWLLARQLRDAGVRVTGRIAVRHRAITPADDPAKRGGAPVARAPEPAPLARLTPPPLAEDIRHTNKVSQNLHADLLLRRVGAVSGSGSVADGQARVDAMLAAAGVPRDGYDFADGSGMSNYNRITPRTAVRLLRWAQAQPWGAAWRATLPVGGQDGTLARRFAGTALAGKLFAKTGTLNAANALSGYLVTASGRTYAFSALANDMPQDASATRAVDRALLAVAAAH
ncbi:MAG: D-alanyl-D-alanine carboxypeptidase/D-alanyl-D-alanine-endopeptidase, partial [Pseudomonadota bacterium]|nr:D-alanyl-D-alanine carboxypeptidase/D-alanyl-D-alanine-endopeptidase [Pseudomonadota bacterium]